MKTMAIIVALLFSAGPVLARVSYLPDSVRQRLSAHEKVSVIRTTEELTSGALRVVAPSGRMANPGARWNPGCVDGLFPAPHQRLIWAVRIRDIFVVHYENGGRSYWRSVQIVTTAGGSARSLWQASASRQLPDYAAFLRALNTEELDDSGMLLHQELDQKKSQSTNAMARRNGAR